jgi:hypothetical protein
MLQMKISNSTDVNQSKMYQLKLDTIELNSKLLKFLETKPEWKKIISDDAQINEEKAKAFFERRCDKSKLAGFREILRSDVEVLAASLELMLATQKLLMALESKPANALYILKMLFKVKISNFEEQKQPAYVINVDSLKEELINFKRKKIKRIQAFTKIIKNENSSNILLKIRRYEDESKKVLLQNKNELLLKAQALKTESMRLEKELQEIQENIRLEEMMIRKLTLQDNSEPLQIMENNLISAESQQQEDNLTESSNSTCTTGAEVIRKQLN